MRVRHILCRFREVDELVRQLRRPDNVGLIDIHIRIARGQPQAILAELLAAR